MKAIILAGGNGTRLYPITQVVTKQLMPVYDKPMIFYSISILMLAGIKEILLICRDIDLENFKNLLGDGKHLGIDISYKVQNQPNGLPEAFIIGKEFINNENVCLILGDNLFYGDLSWFKESIIEQENTKKGGFIFGYHVSDPRSYGVLEFNRSNGKIISIEEKPENPKSNLAIPGLYLFDGTVSQRAENLKPSKRGELEITDIMQSYFNEGSLLARQIGRGVAWLDTGTPRSLIDASAYIAAIEARQNLKVACLEEVAYRKGFIDKSQLENRIQSLPNCSYRSYLETLVSQNL